MTVNPLAKFLLQLPWFRKLATSTEPVRAITNTLVGLVTTAGAILVVLISQYPHSHYLILGASIVAAAASVLGIKVAGTVTRASVSPVGPAPSPAVTPPSAPVEPLDAALVAQVAFATSAAPVAAKAPARKKAPAKKAR